MKNFLRGLRFAWPYRHRFALSVLFALLSALLWGANLTAVYPVLSLLVNDKSWEQQIDDSIDELQAGYDKNQAVLATRRADLTLAEALPAKDRLVRERELASSVQQIEARQASAARKIYLQQLLKGFFVRHLPADRFRTLCWLFAILLVAVLVKGVFEFWQESLVGSVTNLTLFDLRNAFFRRAVRLDLQQFTDTGTTDLMARFTNDVEQFGSGAKTLFGKVVAEPLKMVACLAIASYISWQLTLLFMVLVPVAVLTLAKVGQMMKRASKRLLERLSTIYKILQEVFVGIKAVKGFTMEARERRRFRDATREYYVKAMRVVNIDALTSPIMEFIGVTGVTIALLVGAYLVMDQKTHLFGMRMTEYPLNLQTLLQLYAMLAAVADPVRKLSSVYTKLQAGAAAADRIFGSMDREPTVGANRGGVYLDRHSRGIEFREVCFSYEPGRAALSNVSLTVPFGQTVALVGPNGCGKTTLLGLLPRFFDPGHGEVRIDGVDLRRAHLRSVRRQIGLVTQDAILFDGSVAANIAYGRKHATAEQVEAAARQAFAHDFVAKLPRGYDTSVGEGGAKLSGGQRQRLALARAILRDPAILILDEFTSQCDPESEQLIHQALREFVRGRTTFIITHRLNTLEIADRVVVLDRGRVEASGTHAELMAQSATYQRLNDAAFTRRAA